MFKVHYFNFIYDMIHIFIKKIIKKYNDRRRFERYKKKYCMCAYPKSKETKDYELGGTCIYCNKTI